MAATVAEMTVAELRDLIGDVVAEKLAEAVDRDEGLRLRPEFEARIRERMAAVDRGERGVAGEDVFRRLGL
jgi:hypothetical protein